MDSRRGQAASKQAESVKTAEPVQPNESEEEREVKEMEGVAEEEEKVVDGAGTSSNAGTDMKDYMIADVEAEIHAALLACPPHGSEIHIVGLSSDTSEEDLKIFCESVGQVARVKRWKRTCSLENLFSAFVEYESNELAAKAVQELNDTTLKGKKLSCSRSYSKHCLLICNVPRSMTEDVLIEALEKIGPGVSHVHLIMESSDCNQGCAFVQYYNHACAEYSRNKLSDPKFKLYSNMPTVIWAPTEMRAVYVKNLPKNVTQDQLRRLFEHHGEIITVNLPPAKSGKVHRIGFVHFAHPSSARSATSEKYHLDGQDLECSLAKPATERKGATGPNTQEGPLLQNVPSQIGYGVMGDANGALGYGMMGYADGAPGYSVMGDTYGALGYSVMGDIYGASGYSVMGSADGAPGYSVMSGPYGAPGYRVMGGAYSAPGYDVMSGVYGAPGYSAIVGAYGVPGNGVMGGGYGGPGYSAIVGAYGVPGNGVMGGGAYGVSGNGVMGGGYGGPGYRAIVGAYGVPGNGVMGGGYDAYGASGYGAIAGAYGAPNPSLWAVHALLEL
ncbi:Heterogeneous nuclear ribonucleoprotein R (RRM superfamily) protein [Dioscorea alata]|uniref:Heterogeneous nuclear ribonucleoprotein R (RRM superfamily) protein n=1 Tax=Dioscorea alata TaxID=55571 RepID=A0ACB7W3D4_DIOAL|nr:Heterogeneous nuclear ribonucleoprotein R (RRM superfamily) protein [Dioscorea alata]